MDINAILKGIDCSCGKKHTCAIEYVYIEKGATSRLVSVCEGFENLLVVADENTYGAAGKLVEEKLCAKNVKKVIFPGSSFLIPNEDAIQKVNENMEGIDMIVGIGSGVIQDLCKYVSFFSKVPYIVVATAPSMDGYASDGAAMILRGMKETVKAGLPKAIIADVDILKNCPLEMLKAGYGDIIGKYSALCDWKLSHIVNGEYICDYIYDTTSRMIEKTRECAKGIIAREDESVKVLFEALIVVGIMMSFAGSSRPASGSEHHLSHFFEIVGIVDSQEYFCHGIDVAYSTVVTTRIREKIMSSDFPARIFRPGRKDYEQKMKDIYKSVAQGCIDLQDKIGNYAAERLGVYTEKKAEIFKAFSEMPSSEQIKEMLAEVELDISDFYRMYSREKVDRAISYAKDLKDRYTVLWMYYDLFGEKKLNKQNIKMIAMDLDGTLTQHKQPLSEEHKNALVALSQKYKLIMVGAGQVTRIFNQLGKFPIDIIGNYGLQYGKYNSNTESIDVLMDLSFPVNKDDIEKKADFLRKKHGFTEFSGNSIEYHPSGCVTLAILGTTAKQEDKLAFDPDRIKRRRIYSEVCRTFSDYNVFVGGSSSFDMAPKPYNKYYALDLYCKENGISHDEVVFIGDDYGMGGNDESVYLSDFNYICIDNYKDFTKVIKPLLD